jgi:ABC-type spermidine/putrescine transport system permease subunit I
VTVLIEGSISSGLESPPKIHFPLAHTINWGLPIAVVIVLIFGNFITPNASGTWYVYRFAKLIAIQVHKHRLWGMGILVDTNAFVLPGESALVH